MHKCTRISHEISPEINFKQCVILINEIKLRLRSYNLPTYLLRFGDLLRRLPTIISRSLDRYKQPWTCPGGREGQLNLICPSVTQNLGMPMQTSTGDYSLGALQPCSMVPGHRVSGRPGFGHRPY